MSIVTGNFPDYKKYDKQGSFRVTADQGMDYTTWSPPINWTGWVNNEKVSFIQTSAGAYGVEDFEFGDFPKNCGRAIPYIIKAIDDAMRIMD